MCVADSLCCSLRLSSPPSHLVITFVNAHALQALLAHINLLLHPPPPPPPSLPRVLVEYPVYGTPGYAQMDVGGELNAVGFVQTVR